MGPVADKLSSISNYEFCAEYCAQMGVKRVLDFGCGAGQIVRLLRERQIDAYGCEAFYGGGASPIPIDLKEFVLPMEGDKAPFGNETFDLVLNNQVMEHVDDIDAVVAEMHRVLKPGGCVLSLFPDNRVWREGHCGIPFLHWFPKNSGPRIYYAAALIRLGLGYRRKGKPALARAARDVRLVGHVDDLSQLSADNKIL